MTSSAITESSRPISAIRSAVFSALASRQPHAEGPGSASNTSFFWHPRMVRAETDADPPTIGQIADRLLIHHHSAVGLADRLEERGLVERLRGAGDRRTVRLRLTMQGAEILERLSALHSKELRQSGPDLVAALEHLLEGVTVDGGQDDAA